LILSQRRFSLPSGFSFEAIVLGCYLVRGAFGGVMRYYTNVLHVDALWFTPDLLAMLCLVQFVRHCIIRNGSTFAALVLLQVLLSLVLGYFMLGTFNALSSSFKMMLPGFVGFCFCDSNLGSYKRLLSVIAVTFYLCLVGVFVSKFCVMPLVGVKYDAVGGNQAV